MPSPMIGDVPRPRPSRHAAAADDESSRTTEIRLREVPARPRGEIASGLPPWDLLPPVEFVRRHRGGT